MRFNETDNASPGQLDFVPRRRRNQIWQIIFAFGLTVVLILALGALSPSGKNISALFFSVFMVVCLCFYVVYRKQQSLDLVMDTEYQNLLFAQAVALGTSFCVFVRRDGTIVYANDGLRKLFPHSAYANAQALETLFEQANVQKSDRERVMAAIYNNSSDRLIFPLRIPGEGQKEYILTVDPLTRPSGFLVLRGREYLGQRAGLQLLPDVLRSTSADKLDHMLAHTPIAHYTTDLYGRLEYVNPAFEQLAGYAAGEMTEAKITMQQMLDQLNGQPLPQDYTLADYQGKASLQHKKNAPVAITLFQYVIRDDLGKVIGASGSILSHAAAP